MIQRSGNELKLHMNPTESPIFPGLKKIKIKHTPRFTQACKTPCYYEKNNPPTFTKYRLSVEEKNKHLNSADSEWLHDTHVRKSHILMDQKCVDCIYRI